MLRQFDNRVLRKVFGPKRDGIRGQWRRSYDEEFYDLYRHAVAQFVEALRCKSKGRGLD
jgi:hypothetical protein